jgi:hypothetical protein
VEREYELIAKLQREQDENGDLIIKGATLTYIDANKKPNEIVTTWEHVSTLIDLCYAEDDDSREEGNHIRVILRNGGTKALGYFNARELESFGFDLIPTI